MSHTGRDSVALDQLRGDGSAERTAVLLLCGRADSAVAVRMPGVEYAEDADFHLHHPPRTTSTGIISHKRQLLF